MKNLLAIIFITIFFIFSCSNNCKNPVVTQNTPPSIEEILFSPEKPVTNSSVNFNAIVIDKDNDSLIYNWFSSSGKFQDQGVGNPITWYTPNDSGVYKIKCIVNDGKSLDSMEIFITVFSEKGNLDGYVYDIDTKDALEGVKVSVDNLTSVTDHNGYFRIDNITVGAHKQVIAKLDGYDEYSNLIYISKGNNYLKIYMRKSRGKLFGYVYDKSTNTPVKYVYVSIEKNITSTTTNGYYEFNNLYIGNHIISINDANYKFFSDTITINKGENKYDIYLEPVN